MAGHTDKYYSKNLNLGPEGLPVDKKYVGSTVFKLFWILCNNFNWFGETGEAELITETLDLS